MIRGAWRGEARSPQTMPWVSATAVGNLGFKCQHTGLGSSFFQPSASSFCSCITRVRCLTPAHPHGVPQTPRCRGDTVHALLTPLLPDHIPIPGHTSRCHMAGTLQLKKHLACSKPGMGKWFPPPCQATHGSTTTPAPQSAACPERVNAPRALGAGVKGLCSDPLAVM